LEGEAIPRNKNRDAGNLARGLTRMETLVDPQHPLPKYNSIDKKIAIP